MVTLRQGLNLVRQGEFVNLPDADGFAVAEALAGACAVVLISSRDRADLGPALRRSRARGFIPKERLSPATLAELLP